MEIVTWNKAQDHWLGVGDTNSLIFDNEELLHSQRLNQLAAGPSELAVLTKPEYIYFAVKFFLNVTLFPFQAAMLSELLTRPFPLLLMSRGGGKTYMLAIHSLMKSLFNPEHKVVIAGAGFRQSKQVFENIEKIWDNAPMLRSVCSKNSGARHDNDRWTFNINNSSIVAIPVGCLAEDTLITTNNGISTIKDVWVDGTDNCQVWDGEKFTTIGFHHYNGIKPTLKVITECGFEYIGTYDHKMKIMREGQIVWVETQNMEVGDKILIDARSRYFGEKFNNDHFLDGCILYGKGQECKNSADLEAVYKENRWFCVLKFLCGLCSVRETDGLIDCSGFTEKDIKKLQFLFTNVGCLTKIVDGGLLFANISNSLFYDNIVSISKHIDIPTYDIHVPEHNTYIANGFISHNTGEKIRGLRAHTIVADEFASHSPDIYETVIAGFGSVSNDVVGNVQKAAAREILIEEGLWDENAENEFLGKQSNQSIITGTASYSFNHFYEYYKKYKGIIESRGDHAKLEEALNGQIPEGFNWKDYSIMRIPFSHMPEGFMDAKTVGRAKATVHTSIYLMEYECCFCEDSDGFFKRSLIEFCTASEKNVKKHNWPAWCPTHFEAMTHGDLNKKYVYGIDPAFQQDNFAITVLEIYNTHARIVYVWTVNKNKFMDYIKNGLTPEHDYYQFCSRKIRDLMKVFPPAAIGIDAQGGGRTIEQALHDNTRLKAGELPLWPVIEEKAKETDNMPGLHILHMVQFGNQGWTADANYGLLNDLQGRTILFPHFDQISLELAAGQDLIREKAFEEKFNKTLTITDSLEDCVLEIEELKEELASIRMSYTGSGVTSREKWSTPEIKLSGDRKGYLRKDRYSSLIIANSLARLFRNKLPDMDYECYGGIVKDLRKKTGVMYTGPEWATSKLNSGKFGVLINANNKNK